MDFRASHTVREARTVPRLPFQIKSDKKIWQKHDDSLMQNNFIFRLSIPPLFFIASLLRGIKV
jgi:hypothetical protein